MSPEQIDASHFSPDTVEFLRCLEKHRVRYVVVGGEAVIYHGFARLTGDVDFFYDPDERNAQQLFRALQDFWDGDVPGIDRSDDLARPDTIIQFGVPPNRIDLLSRVDGVQFEECWPHRIDVILSAGREQIVARYIGLAELIRNKRASGRPKDVQDLEYLEHREDT